MEKHTKSITRNTILRLRYFFVSFFIIKMLTKKLFLTFIKNNLTSAFFFLFLNMLLFLIIINAEMWKVIFDASFFNFKCQFLSLFKTDFSIFS